MEQQPLFFESVFDALKHITHVVGPKTAGAALFPTKPNPEAAARSLSDKLNSHHGEKLDIEQVIHLLRLGKDAGCHVAIEYICSASGYSKPNPIDPSDEKAELQRTFIKSVQDLSLLASRIKSINGGGM